ncbi:hypothetical protein K437DRAFT_64083 [Tilletiaria anomala UBC 951]|uniref:Phosphatidate cytidylyltransferase n=1 Tax=Tilletiaria anomala (strain ATCC 24038 / CBS 436.72 / UBC 951) TaxID=1037660 RepID=A0A066V6V7_TILAU|nr:uncharacterized protein K437DRAFT_64083 [Tilletiaria anomala UBC 951]KDN36013.1 hypothetical protein K437DRAFT_64083 [Tilletiaria anomala UBC 951]
MQSDRRPNGGMARARSASFERVSAVVRALARPQEDPEPETPRELTASPSPSPSPSPSCSPSPNSHSGEGPATADGLGIAIKPDSGHVESEIRRRWHPIDQQSLRSPSAAADDEAEWQQGNGLTQAEKEAGRARRQELKAGSGTKTRRKTKGGSAGRRRGSRDLGNIKRKTVKPAKSWEIPRKIFHSSIGFLVLYLYLCHHPLDKIVTGLTRFLGVVVTADVIRLNWPAFERIYESVLGFLMRESEKKQVNGVVWYLVGVITSLQMFPADVACVSIMILSWCDTSASVFGRLFGRHTSALPSPPFAARKSLAGFLAAVISGSLTAFAFWGTSVAFRGERADGLSWAPDRPAIFGTANAPGPHGTGWSILAHGISGRKWWDAGLGTSKGSSSTSFAFPGNAVAAAVGRVGSTAAPATPRWLSASSVPAMPLWLLCAGSGLVAGVAEGLELGGIDDNLSLPILSATGIWGLLWAWGRVVTCWVR